MQITEYFDSAASSWDDYSEAKAARIFAATVSIFPDPANTSRVF